MNRLPALLLALTAALASSWASPASIPGHVQIRYSVSLGAMKIGEGVALFEHDGKTYSIVSESKTAGLAAMLYPLDIHHEAKGSVNAEGLRPVSFVEMRNGRFKRGANFDWSANEVQLTDGDKKQTLPLPPNTWDTTSFPWNFLFVQPKGKDLLLHLTDGRRITEYRYAILGREKLDTPLGAMETLHVKKVQDPGDSRAFEVWLAVDRHFLPVRTRYTENGTELDSLVESIEPAQQ
ncbi:MAG TPA: DUF3108 domain-containing protein [Burkholderiales bacterium]|nr:DUF3108 domain-containing protein [Burkholderiales bacterium]